MKKETFFEVFGDIDESYVADAEAAKGRMPLRFKRCLIAACLCIAISIGVMIPVVLEHSEPEQLSTGGHLEIIDVELVEWQDDGFKATVVDTGNSSIFPAGAELTVIFREHHTEIVLHDGTSFGWGEEEIEDIGCWEAGFVIEVSFGTYERYDALKGYGNRVYAYRVQPYLGE